MLKFYYGISSQWLKMIYDLSISKTFPTALFSSFFICTQIKRLYQNFNRTLWIFVCVVLLGSCVAD